MSVGRTLAAWLQAVNATLPPKVHLANTRQLASLFKPIGQGTPMNLTRILPLVTVVFVLGAGFSGWMARALGLGLFTLGAVYGYGRALVLASQDRKVNEGAPP